MKPDRKSRSSGTILTIFIAATLLHVALPAVADEKKEEPRGDAYPLGTCIVSGAKLGSMGDPYLYDHNGREIRFCCSHCAATFQTDAENYLKKIDEQIIKQQLPYYPLKTCVVSGDALSEEEGGAVNHVSKNRLVRFCCRGCISQFEKAPKTYWKKIDQAVIEKQKTAYPLATCVVSGEKLDAMGGAVDYVHANRLVRLCCKGCIDPFRKDPNQYMTVIDRRLKEKAAESSAPGRDEEAASQSPPTDASPEKTTPEHGAHHQQVAE